MNIWKKQRVIFLLEDGRMKYAINNKGEIETWDAFEICCLQECFDRGDYPGISNDLSLYCSSYEAMAELFPGVKSIRIVGFETEDCDLPTRKNAVIRANYTYN